MIVHRCSAAATSTVKCTKDTYARLLIYRGERYCRAHLPPGARRDMQVNCTHSFVDPATGGECTYCGAVVPWRPT